MKRAHVSPLLLILTATISLCCGVGITLIAEDLIGIPLQSIDSNSISIPQAIKDMDLTEILNWLEDHPELTDEIINHIKDLIESGDYSIEDLQNILNDHPELAGVIGEYIQQYIDNLKDEEEPAEGNYNHDSGMGTIDDGSFDPEGDQTELFTVDSTYKGKIYIRNTSYGDYLYGKGMFDKAPEFDASTYMASPLLYAGFGFNSAGWSDQTLSFHLSEKYTDYGMLVGDYSSTYYTVSDSNEKTRFSKSTESRMRRIEEKEYTVPFYPTYSPSDVALPSYLKADEQNYYAYARQNYRSIPDELEPYIQLFISDNSLADNSTPKQVEQFFKQNYSYEAKALKTDGYSDTVLAFLNSSSKSGTCTNFASAMTLICRRLGYCARMVGGYSIKAAVGLNSVKGSDAHAWVEVYSSGHGWVRFDPTPVKRSKDEAEQTGGSNGEVGDQAYDPSVDKTLFTISTNCNAAIYLRSASFLDYDPEKSAFNLDSIDSSESSLLYMSKAIEIELGNLGKSYLIQMHMDDYRDTGMIFASYPSSTYYAGKEDDDSKFDEDLRAVSDGRFFREDLSEYTYAFYPESNTYATIDDSSYYSAYANQYLNLPDGYFDILKGFCSSNGIASLSDLTRFFMDECDLDNTLTGYEGDAILNFLNVTHKGNSSVFAGAYTLLARYFGTPARYVAGYKLTNGSNSLSKPTNVKTSNAYYWVETYEKGYGWQREDPISSLQARPDGKTKITLTSVNKSFEYDGKEHAPSAEANIEVSPNSENQLFEGDYIASAKFPSDLKTTKCKQFASIPFKNVVICDKHGNDVSDRYDITSIFLATFEVIKKEISVTTENKALSTSSPSYNVTSDDLESTVSVSPLANGDKCTLNYPSATLGEHDVGSSFSNNPTLTITNSNNEDVTDQYAISYSYGMVSIVESEEEENV